MKFQIGYDSNGNKIVKIQITGKRGFSIQTLGNLKATHRMTKDKMDHATIEKEVREHVEMFGTDKQKQAIG